MESTAISKPAGFSNLSKAEQVRYLQALWDRIVENPSKVPVPETYLEVAEHRRADTDAIWTKRDRPTTSLTAWARKLGDRVPTGFNNLLGEPLLAEISPD